MKLFKVVCAVVALMPLPGICIAAGRQYFPDFYTGSPSDKWRYAIGSTWLKFTDGPFVIRESASEQSKVIISCSEARRCPMRPMGQFMDLNERPLDSASGEYPVLSQKTVNGVDWVDIVTDWTKGTTGWTIAPKFHKTENFPKRSAESLKCMTWAAMSERSIKREPDILNPHPVPAYQVVFLKTPGNNIEGPPAPYLIEAYRNYWVTEARGEWVRVAPVGTECSSYNLDGPPDPEKTLPGWVRIRDEKGLLRFWFIPVRYD